MKLFSVSEELDQLNFSAIWGLFPYTEPEKVPSELNEEADIDFDDGIGEMEIQKGNKAILDIEIKEILNSNREIISQFLQKFDDGDTGDVSKEDFENIFTYLDKNLDAK